MLEQLSSRIADKIADNTEATDESREVIRYGIMAVLHISFFLLLIALLGLIFNAFMPILTICLSAALFRQYSGGAHALNSLFCTSIGCAVCLGLSLVCKNVVKSSIHLSFYIIISVTALLLAVLATAILVPVDTPNKPIKSEKKKKRMKKNSYITLAIYTVLLILAIILGQSYAGWRLFNLCMCVGILWQTFMLTKVGELFLKYVQIPLNKIQTLLFHH